MRATLDDAAGYARAGTPNIACVWGFGAWIERWLAACTWRYQHDESGGSLVYLAEPDVFDDGDTKPVRIWSRIGRRPVVAGGNSNGDIPMLHYTGGPSRHGLRLLLLHDDPEREFDYTAGAEKSLELADEEGWTVVSIKSDWATVFADIGG